MKCDCCSKEVEKIHRHHVLPKSLGGIDDESNIVSACLKCHGLIHGSVNIFELSRLGRAKGNNGGAPKGNRNRTGKSKLIDAVLIRRIKNDQRSLRIVAKEYGCSPAKIWYLKKNPLVI